MLVIGLTGGIASGKLQHDVRLVRIEHATLTL